MPRASDYANIHNLPLVETLYEKWQQNPESVETSWRYFFEGLELGRYAPPKQKGGVSVDTTTTSGEHLQWQVSRLIYAYRSIGHRLAHLDPLSEPKSNDPDLEL